MSKMSQAQRVARTLKGLRGMVAVNIAAHPDYWAEKYRVVYRVHETLILGQVELIEGERVFTPNKWFGLEEILSEVKFSVGAGGFDYLRNELVRQVLVKGGGL